MKIIIGITGASGVILGYRMLQALKQNPDIETHLVVSDAAVRNFELETDITIDQVKALADIVYDSHDMAANISSGSYETDGMIIIPCSMKTLSNVVTGNADNLIARAADVCMKENRRLILVPREMPLSKLHLRNLSLASDLGCTIIPPMLTFYNGANTMEQQMDHIIGKVLMQFHIKYDPFKPWSH